MMFNWGSGPDHMHGAWSWFGAGMMIVWMILLVVVGVALVTWLMRSNRPDTSDQLSPREIVDRRYANGEIDADEREQMHRKLSKNA